MAEILVECPSLSKIKHIIAKNKSDDVLIELVLLKNTNKFNPGGLTYVFSPEL